MVIDGLKQEFAGPAFLGSQPFLFLTNNLKTILFEQVDALLIVSPNIAIKLMKH
jgi:hypothetical protein